jgi:hypothetical protein
MTYFMVFPEKLIAPQIVDNFPVVTELLNFISSLIIKRKKGLVM